MRQATRYYKETPEGVRQMCTIFEEIKREGYEQGMEKGMQQGMQQGMEKGMQQGRDEQAQAVYERLLALNMPEAQARAVAFG
jgi:flagellar biosynthesis/type III secretory pathway protein FliH